MIVFVVPVYSCTMNKLLDAVYYNTSSPACFAGVNAVYREARKRNPEIKLETVKDYLERQHAYTTHKPIRKNFRRNKIVAYCIDSHWQADLCDMQKLATYNEGYRYILTCIDVFSKFAWGIPIKDKKPTSTRDAFMKILKGGRKPWWLLTDSGNEFLGKPFQDLMLKKMIVHYVATSFPQVKCPNVERFNRTLKTRLWKYFAQRSTYRYINILQTMISSINHSYSEPIRCRPVDVTMSNEKEIRKRLYGTRESLDQRRKKLKFKVGDEVRIVREKKQFEKGYESNFTTEIFTIVECLLRDPPVYRVRRKF